MRGWGGRVPLWGSLANRHIFRMRARWRSGRLGERRPERGRFRVEAGAAFVLRRLEADHRPGGLSLAAGAGGPAVHLHVLWLRTPEPIGPARAGESVLGTVRYL